MNAVVYFVMAATITWDIATLERKIADGVVYAVHYTIGAEDQGEICNAYGSLALDPADPNSFIPYDNLDKATVISWVKAKLGNEQVALIETNLESQLQEQLAPQDATGVPW